MQLAFFKDFACPTEAGRSACLHGSNQAMQHTRSILRFPVSRFLFHEGRNRVLGNPIAFGAMTPGEHGRHGARRYNGELEEEVVGRYARPWITAARQPSSFLRFPLSPSLCAFSLGTSSSMHACTSLWVFSEWRLYAYLPSGSFCACPPRICIALWYRSVSVSLDVAL